MILSQKDSESDFKEVYVCNLDQNVNDAMLMDVFQKIYPSVLQAKIIVNPVTRLSKGYGFLKFKNHEDSLKAIVEMQGKYLLTKPMKLNYAIQKKGEPNMVM